VTPVPDWYTWGLLQLAAVATAGRRPPFGTLGNGTRSHAAEHEGTGVSLAVSGKHGTGRRGTHGWRGGLAHLEGELSEPLGDGCAAHENESREV
jgi:hypothetical protein